MSDPATRKLELGDVVTVRKSVKAFYSGYVHNPVITLKPGDLAIVGAIDVPAVRQEPGQLATYTCVDFVRPFRTRHPTNCVWRASVYRPNVIWLGQVEPRLCVASGLLKYVIEKQPLSSLAVVRLFKQLVQHIQLPSDLCPSKT